MPSLSVPNTPRKAAKRSSEVYENGVLAHAIDRSLEIKCLRMRAFLTEHRNSLHLHIAQLRQFASSPGGLVLDEIRAIVWPVLANCLVADTFRDQDSGSTTSDSDFESAQSNFSDEAEKDESPGSSRSTVVEAVTLDDLKGHGEWNQVEMDVHRTLARFPPNISESQRSLLQEELTPLIVRILWCCPRFRYYQGFHDVCLTLLLVLGVESAERVGLLLARYGAFNGYLLQSLEETVLRDLDLLYVITWRVDAEVEKVMRSVELGSLFALSWPLTWFSHALHHYKQIVLCFDLFLASHPLMPIYFTTAVVLWRSSSILSTSRDMASLHHLLNVMPDDVPVQALVADAQDLYRMLPPSLVRGPLLDDYRRVLKEASVRRPSLPTPSLKAWLVAGTATASIYVLSRYLFMPS
uniref:TBC1 domain family member 20 n=1 Tax=Ascaris suum TaxID=6253 RepID=F1L776_ASCSU